jgi:hypothetical protein
MMSVQNFMNFRPDCLVTKYKVTQKNFAHFTHPLHRDEELVLEETGCVLSGGQRNLFSMDHWTAAHCAFAVEPYFENNESKHCSKNELKMCVCRIVLCVHYAC